MSILRIRNKNTNDWEEIQAIKGEKGDTGATGADAKINGVNTINIEAGDNITLEQEGNTLTINSTGGGGGGTSDYSDLTNKPQINSVTLSGNKSLSDLGIQPVGNYALESEIPDVSNFITNTDYATSSKGGVIKTGNALQVWANSGVPYASEITYANYGNQGANTFIGKGTLENVITGKGLIDSSSDITGNASTSTTLKSFDYSRKGTNYTWAKVATATLIGTWEERHAYLFVKGTHNSNFKQNGIISIDVVGNGTKAKVNSYSAQFISASTDLNVENFYIEYQDGNDNTPAILNFWVKNTTNTYASWQFKILQNTGWTIESADTSVTTLPTQDFTGKISELNNKTLKDKDGNDISTTYVKNTDYAGPNKAGVIRTNPDYGTGITSVGTLISATKTYQQYQDTTTNNMFISKGTLENVITGKGLIDNTYHDSSKQDTLVSGTNIKTINNTSILGSGNISLPQVTDSYSASTSDSYSCNYVNGLNTYSTTEQRIGTWTDGKPLYRKVCTLACGNKAQTVIAHGITNANIKKLIGSATNGSTTVTAGFNDEFYMNNTNVSWNTKLDRRAYTATIIIEYTKTTDV